MTDRHLFLARTHRALLCAVLLAAAPHTAQAQTLQGRAVDRETQQPVAGAEITLVDAQGESAGTARSGADGSFQVAGTAAGEYRLAARSPGYQVMLSSVVRLAEGEVLQVEARLTPQPAETAALPRATSRGITGRVVEAGTGRPVGSAAVTLLNERGHHVVQATADGNGNFHIAVPQPGRIRLRADRVGYQRSTSEAITVAPDDTVRVELLMSTDAVVLAPLTVVAASRSVSRNSRMASFQWRAEHNPWGRFVGPEQIRRINPMFATDILQQVHGVRVEGSGLNRYPTVRGRFGSRCVPTFVVDGHRSSGISLDELVGGPDIAAMEVYDQPFEAPPEFLPAGNQLACGVIVVWTKRATRTGD
ncbi:carboxypeptidase regulatory-like domain-containing protein [Longimicrobium sp.]|uniref:carboxypeptidase regulatory-like domain-containing protein n=1 Tax=Longimicrobium sp. TaxID=2029185 RepID=UPI003B3BBF1E